MSQILNALVARLEPYTLAELEAIAHAAGVSPDLPRKLRSGERSNPTVRSIEPLIDYFNKVDRGLVLPSKGARHG
jgi:hypothetical protein